MLSSAGFVLSLCNRGAPFSEAGRLFERVRHLQDAEVRLVAADDLQSNGKPFRGESRRHRGRGIAGGRDIPAGLHPVDVVIELNAGDLRRVRHIDVEGRQLRGGQNEVFVFFQECLKAPPNLAVRDFGACHVRAGQAAVLPRSQP